MNYGSSYDQCARCFSKDLTSISRRAQLPTPEVFLLSLLRVVLLLHPLVHLVFRNTSRSILTHYLSHTQLCHTPSLTYDLSHGTLSHTIFHTQSLTHHLTHNFVTHRLSHTIFHTPSLTHHLSHHFATHHLSHAVTDHLSHTIFVTHHLWHMIFHTPLCHTPSFTHNL